MHEKFIGFDGCIGFEEISLGNKRVAGTSLLLAQPEERR